MGTEFIFIGLFIGSVFGVISVLARLPEKGGARGVEKEEEGAGGSEELHDIMLEAFRRVSPNSRGVFSRDLLNLSTAIQKLEAGEGVPVGVCVYLLEKVGAGDLAEKARGAGV